MSSRLKTEAEMTLFSNVLWGLFQRALLVSNVLCYKNEQHFERALQHVVFSTCFAEIHFERGAWQAAKQQSTSFSLKEFIGICRHMHSQTHTHYGERIGTRFKVLWSKVFGRPAHPPSEVGTRRRNLRGFGLRSAALARVA